MVISAIRPSLGINLTRDIPCTQQDIPLLEGLLEHIQRGASRFHVPGHKGHFGVPSPLLEALGPAVFRMDLTELDPIDHLQKPHWIISQAQD